MTGAKKCAGGGRQNAPALAVVVAAVLAAAPAASADPRIRATAELRAVRGVVLVSKPGEEATTRVRGTRTIRMGSVVDATNGVVDVTTAKNRRGGTQTGRFRDGAFSLSQSSGSSPYTVLDLTKGDESGCASGSVRAAGSTTRRLWGRARGRFRTRGRSATATIRGTTWMMEDTCESSRVGAIEGTVELASGTREITVEEGEVWDLFCGDNGFAGPPGDISFYCQILNYELPRSRTRRDEDGPLGYLSFGLYISAETLPVPPSASLCIRNLSSGADRCTEYPFVNDCREFPGELCELSLKASDICYPERPAAYAVRWRIGEFDLPVTQETGRTATPDPFWPPRNPAKPCAFSTMDPLPRPLLP